MLAEFSILPLESRHRSQDVAKVIETLKATGLEYRLGPLGTCVEGDWEPVLAAIRRCHQAVATGHDRILTTIVIDERTPQPHHSSDTVTSVEQQANRRVPRSDMDTQC
jgi:uncharacterized protein (TIGR00106 family)